MTALIVGATGATGKDLLRVLLGDPDVNQVHVFVRRRLELQHAKLSVHVIDFDHPGEWAHLVKGDVLFSCLGTTLAAAGSKEAQWKIDHDYQYEFAKAAKDNGVSHYVLVSSSNASPKSPFFYARMKGQLDLDVTALGFQKLSIFKPPMLIRKGSDRKGEVIGLRVLRFLNGLGLLKAQKPMPTEVLARAMVHAAKASGSGTTVLEGKAIWDCSGLGSM